MQTENRSRHDVVVVGGRVAGSATAMATPSVSPRPANVPGSCVEPGVELTHRHASRDGRGGGASARGLLPAQRSGR